MNESYVTVIGNLTADLVLRTTKNGKPFATFRMASTPRRWDGREQAYVDGGTNFVSVVTFNALAANVVASLAKGQPAIVYGRLRVNTWSTAEGKNSTSVEIDAYHVGHDLTRGQSHFTKAARAQFDTTDRLASPEIQHALAVASGELDEREEPEDFEDIEDLKGMKDLEDHEDNESTWAPLTDELPATLAAESGSAVGTGLSWSGPDPETDAYVVAKAS